MPELPEVETIRRSLAPLHGKQIIEVGFSPLAPVETTTPAELRRHLEGSTLAAPRRRGKYLLLPNHAGAAVVIHLGMSGQIRLHPRGLPPAPPHRHFWLLFSDGSALDLVDPRRFGTLSLSREPLGADNPFLARLGPDYDDPGLNAAIFLERCRRHPGHALKSLALHQGVAAGLG
ncbi:MAG: DNA-formamidopyrimidine glycosylase family protein, partial [Candidatus Binatia bacterium]